MVTNFRPKNHSSDLCSLVILTNFLGNFLKRLVLLTINYYTPFYSFRQYAFYNFVIIVKFVLRFLYKLFIKMCICAYKFDLFVCFRLVSTHIILRTFPASDSLLYKYHTNKKLRQSFIFICTQKKRDRSFAFFCLFFVEILYRTKVPALFIPRPSVSLPDFPEHVCKAPELHCNPSVSVCG